MARFKIVRMIFDVALTLTAIFKKHLAANSMEGGPLLVATRRSQFMFALDHVSTLCTIDRRMSRNYSHQLFE